MFKPNCVAGVIAPEILLKSDKVRKHMQGILKENIFSYLKKSNAIYSLNSFSAGRFFIESTKPNEIIAVLSKCFGIHAMALAQNFVCDKEKDIFDFIFKKGVEVSEKEISSSFAVRCKSYFGDVSASEVERELGGKVLENNPKLKVNLSNPNKTLHCIVFKDKIYFYFNEERAAGGMPVGSQGTAALICNKNKSDCKSIAFSILKQGCNLCVFNPSKVDLSNLEEWNVFRPLKECSLNVIQKQLFEEKVKAVFSCANTLKEAESDSKLLKAKVFSPFICVKISTPFSD